MAEDIKIVSTREYLDKAHTLLTMSINNLTTCHHPEDWDDVLDEAEEALSHLDTARNYINYREEEEYA